jgi:FKBP-type peptidyl-prolyl cis-trans isomerase FklB
VYVDSVVEGGQQLLQKMRVGDRWQVAIGPEHAHGEAGKPPVVGPNEVMVANVKLLEIRK